MGILSRATVILGCRHMAKCEKAAKEIRQSTENRHVVCRFLDLANFDSVTKFAATLHKELSHIDVLINNAGVMKPRTPKTTLRTDDGFERQFGVNHLGHFLLTNLLIDKLINGVEPGRVINVTAESSIEHGKAVTIIIDVPSASQLQQFAACWLNQSMSKSFTSSLKEKDFLLQCQLKDWIKEVIEFLYLLQTIDIDDIEKSSLIGDDQLSQLYYQSKLANIYFTDSLSLKYDGKLTANCLSPGVVKTDINRYASTPLLSPLWIFEPLKFSVLKTPRQGAQTSLHLASDPKKSNTTGRYFDDCEEVTKTCDICDQDLAEKLWTKSEQWTRLKARFDEMKRVYRNIDSEKASDS